MRVNKYLSLVVALISFLGVTNSYAEEHVINAQARVFNPDILYVQPGDTVKFVNMTSHDAKSVEGLIPEGAKPFDSGLGNNLTLKLDVEGVYGYVCVPHIGFGMVGAIIVGKPVNIDAEMDYAKANLKGPYRRIIGKLLKVQRAAKGS